MCLPYLVANAHRPREILIVRLLVRLVIAHCVQHLVVLARQLNLGLTQRAVRGMSRVWSGVVESGRVEGEWRWTRHKNEN